MKFYYYLRIGTSSFEQVENVNKIIGIESSCSGPYMWEHEMKDDDSVYFIDYFLSLLDGKYEKLESIGVLREYIDIWMYYVYDDQCNLEFPPAEMKKLGDNGITLCVSCWDSVFEENVKNEKDGVIYS